MSEKREEYHAEQNRILIMMMQVMNNQRTTVPVANQSTTFTTPTGTLISNNLPQIKEVTNTVIHDEENSKYNDDPWKVGDLPKLDQI
jgi:hypothetical protein